MSSVPEDPAISEDGLDEEPAPEEVAADAAPSPEEETEDELASEISAEIAELAAQRDQYKDIAQRVQADFENYRKRVQQQVRDEADRASSKLAAALLPVLDAAVVSVAEQLPNSPSTKSFSVAVVEVDDRVSDATLEKHSSASPSAERLTPRS